MKHVRINKLLRYGDDLSVEIISELLGETVNSNDKLTLIRNVTDYGDMSIEELIDMKDYIHRILNAKLAIVKEQYVTLDNRINNPDLYTITDEEIMSS